MILRLVLLLALLPSSESKDGPNCKTRIDILDGAELTTGLSTLFNERVNAMSPQDCALTCFHMKCDVAYFHSTARTCQFTRDSSSVVSSFACHRFIAVPTATDNGDADRVSRFCITCSETPPTSMKPVVIQRGKSKSHLIKRVTIPLRPTANTPVHRYAGTWKTTTRRTHIPKRPTSMQRFVVRGPAGNFTISRQPMRLKFGGPRLGGHSHRKYPARYFHTTSEPIRIEAHKLKRKSNGIAKRKR